MQTTTRVTPTSSSRNGAPPTPWFRLVPEDGFLTVILLALIVYITVSSIQAVTPPWAPGLAILSATTALGLLFGYIAVEQGRLPTALVHTVLVAIGVGFAFRATADEVLSSDYGSLWQRTVAWFTQSVFRNAQSTDNSVFLLFLAVLTFLLAYMSMWMVVRARRPWLAVMANLVILLINLNWSSSDKYIFLLIFLLLALLLFVRFTLAENMRQWKRRGMRFSPDLSWDFMQAGAIFAVIVLLLAYLLPAGQANAQLESYLTGPQNPWQVVAQRFQGLFGGVTGGEGYGNAAFFGSTLHLTSTVHLSNEQILHYSVSSQDDPTQYLITETYDTYDGNGNWTQSQTETRRYREGQALPASTQDHRLDTYTITFDQVPGNGEYYLFAPGSEARSFNVPSVAELSSAAQMPTSWAAQQALPQGARYTARGYVSGATEDQLRQVPYPSQAAHEQDAEYSRAILNEYLPDSSGNIPDALKQAAVQATKGTTNMYDAAVHLEDYLHTFTYSTVNPDPPAGVDQLTWFMQQKRGFCTYFASAMALMGRYLGMPTRIASGFTDGSYDSQSNTYQVRGTMAHTWTQIYFGQYGWVNFEPTASFSKFFRPTDTASSLQGTKSPTQTTAAQPKPHTRFTDPTAGGNTTTTARSTSQLADAGIGVSLFVILLLIIAALVLLWWRLLYRGLSPITATFARITRLGTWAGAPPRQSQTPVEYAEQLSVVIPSQRENLQALGDWYTRVRWGRDEPEGIERDLPVIYAHVRGAISRAIAQRARELPGHLLHKVRRWHRF